MLTKCNPNLEGVQTVQSIFGDLLFHYGGRSDIQVILIIATRNKTHTTTCSKHYKKSSIRS